MDYPVKMPVMKISKKELEAIKKEITRRDSAGDNTSVNKTYGPIAASAKPKPKPKPKPKQDITKIPGFQFGRGTE